MTDEHEFQGAPEHEVVATPSMACDHDWVQKWKHHERGRTVEDCSKCGTRRFGDRGVFTLGEVAPWVEDDHKRAYAAAQAQQPPKG